MRIPKDKNNLKTSSAADLRSSEIRYRRLFEAARDGILILDVQTRKITDVNPFMIELLDYTREEFLGKELWEIGLLKDEEANIAAFKELKKNNYIRYKDLPLKTKGGECREVEFVSNVYSEAGRHVIQCNIRDNTEQLLLKDNLRQSEARLANAQRIAHIGNWDWDIPNNQLFWSDEILRICGLTKTQFNGTYEAFLKRVHPEDRQLVKTAVDAALSGDAQYNIEHRLVRPDGDERIVEEIGEVTFDESGNPLHFIGTVQDITDRKLAELALRESEIRLRTIVDTEPECVKVLGLKGELLEMNPAGLAIIEADSIEQVCGSDIIKIIAPEHRQAFARLTKNVLAGRTEILEYEIIGLKGTRRWLETHAAPMANQTGEITSLLGVTRDITEHKRAEKDKLRLSAEIKHQHQRLNNIVGSVPGIVWEVWNEPDAKQRINFVSDYVETMLGYSVEEWLAIPNFWLSIVHPDSRDKTAQLAAANFTSGRKTTLEFRWIAKDGRVFWVESSSLAILDNKGIPIGRRGVTIDITERKKAEEALREQKELLQEIFDHIPVMISFFGSDGHIKLINREGERVRGWTLEEIIGQKLDILAENYPNEQEHQKAQEAMAAATGEWSEFQITSKSGQIIDTAWAYIKLSDRTNIGIGQDITERKYSEALLREKEEQLRQSQKLESVGLLAGGIAHDFNNMLTAINGYSDLTLRRLKDDDPLRRNIEEIKKAGERSADLTHQLLAFSRQQVLQPVVTNLNEIIADTTKMLQRLIGEDIQLTTTLNPKIGRVLIDPGQFSQILMNLAINSRDAMPIGGKLTIETANIFLDSVYTRRHVGILPGAYIMLAISDNGTGMSEKTKHHIFEPFFTTKELGLGTGLGLATVYGIVKQSGGNIEVYSEEGIGTTFKIYLPRVAEPVGAPIINNTSLEMPSGTETILLVEDEEMVRNLSRLILTECGYTVIEAGNGIEAVEIYEKGEYKFDLLMTDVVMPQMGGRVLAEKLIKKLPNLQILFTSGYTNDAIVRHGVIETNTNFIQKPFTPDALANRIRGILDNSDKT